MKTLSEDWIDRCSLARGRSVDLQPGFGWYVTPEDVGDRVEGIKQALDEGDVETAELAAEQLRVDVLYALSRGAAEDAKLCAFLAHEVDYLDGWDQETR